MQSRLGNLKRLAIENTLQEKLHAKEIQVFTNLCKFGLRKASIKLANDLLTDEQLKEIFNTKKSL